MPPLRLVMLGTGTFAEPTFRALLAGPHSVVGLVTQPDRSGGAPRGSTRQVGAGMTQIAAAAGVPAYQPESVNTVEGVATLKGWDADLLVTAAYGQILKADVLGATRLGGINVHGSLLPKYRGAAPVAWAIARGEDTSGVTIIRMTLGLDAGEMLAQEATPIGADETAGELEARLAQIGARLAAATIDRLAAGPVEGAKQDQALVTKAPKLTKENGLIDWSKPAIEVCRQVRAMQPWPTSYSFLHRPGQPPERLLITKVEAGQEAFGPPGTVRPARGAIEVCCGEGVARVLELQPAGKKRMPAAAYLNGRPMTGGEEFR